MSPLARTCRLIIAAVLALCLSPVLRGQSNPRLWILRPPDRLVEYNPVTFAEMGSISVPAGALTHPGGLRVNPRGQVLFDPAAQPAVREQRTPDQRIWLWDGQAATSLAPAPAQTVVRGGQSNSVTESVPECFLSRDGAHLVWFENRFSKLLDGNDVEKSVSTAVRVWQTDLAGGRREEIAAFTIPQCSCGTGVCSETCSEAAFWVPDSGLADFFLATIWVPGQLGSTYESTSLLQRAGGRWASRKLPAALETILDAGPDGAAIVSAVPDAGCCGWENESSDQAFLTMQGKTNTIFDEFQRYGNAAYDVSFYPSAARLSPDLSHVALTVSSTWSEGKEIRLSDQGKADPEALRRVQRGIAETPVVEVLTTAGTAGQVARIVHASLVGWLDDRQVLVIQDRSLAVFDIATGESTPTLIGVESPDAVFLR